MLPSLQRHFANLELQKQRLLAAAHSLSPAQLAARPSPDAWSALDLIEHLVLTEEAALARVPRNLARNRSVPMLDHLRGAAVLAIMWLPTRVKVPRKAGFVAPSAGSIALPELEARWATARRKLTQALEAVPPTQLTAAAFQHPVAGWIGLRFLRSHLHHHMYQWRRIRSAG